MLEDRIKKKIPEIKDMLAKPIINKGRSARGVMNFYNSITNLFADGTRPSQTQIGYLETLEKSLAAFNETALYLREEMDELNVRIKAESLNDTIKDTELQKDLYDALVDVNDLVCFSNQYALFYAGQLGLALIVSEPIENTTMRTYKISDINSKDNEMQTQKIIDDALTLLNETSREAKNILKKTHKEDEESKGQEDQISDKILKDGLRAVYTSWINQFRWKHNKKVPKKFNIIGLPLKYENTSMVDGKLGRGSNEVILENIPHVDPKDVIGFDSDYTKKLKNELRKVAAFDFETWNNPEHPVKSIFTTGAPGCGKSWTAYGVINWLAQKCREHNKPMLGLMHNMTDFSSSYQNVTPVKLRGIADRINKHDGIVVMYVADADNLAGSRSGGRLTLEQKQTLDVYFKMFDGTYIHKNGKFIAIMDANYIDSMDNAYKSRLFDMQLIMERWTKPEYFAEYAKRMITRGTDFALPEENWQEIGRYLLDTPLTNREMDHIFNQVRGVPDLPDDSFSWSTDQHRDYVRKHMQSITKEKIMDHSRQFIETRMESERKAILDKNIDDTRRFYDFLKQEHKDIPLSR